MTKNNQMGLDDRMKEYEKAVDINLIKHIPVAIRIDGRAFHTFAKYFVTPFDDILIEAMQNTMSFLCQNIQGCVLGYSQSDEISIIMYDSDPMNDSAWFDMRKSKIESVSASMATLEFNRQLSKIVSRCMKDGKLKNEKYISIYERAIETGAMFDSRAFNLPEYEVVNYLIWRQEDASKNSVQMVARSLFTHKELQGIKTKQLQNKMFTEKGVNWNDFPTYQKRGSCCIKEPKVVKEGVIRNKWVIDKDIPIFTQNRDYINIRLAEEEI